MSIKSESGCSQRPSILHLMNKLQLRIFFLLTTLTSNIVTSQVLPQSPELNGLQPRTPTIYVNSGDNINNGNTESLGVAVASNGNVLMGWEDDGVNITDLEGVWTLLDANGTSITPLTLQTALTPFNPPDQSVTSRFLSYYRTNGSAVFGGTSWGPKLKANLFGSGLGMGATSFGLGAEVSEFVPYDESNQGDFSSLQLLGDNAEPGKILTGVTSTYATANPGSIRIADWEYLSNGNVLIVSESQQDQDLVTLYGGSDPAHHAVFRILDKSGAVIKAESLGSETPEKSEAWHGAAVTADGFALRFLGPTGTLVRMFDNQGNATSANIDLAAVTGNPGTGSGGRGDSSGFHGNGKDAYVAADTSGTDVYVTVLNTDGTVRYSKSVIDDLTLTSAGAVDAAIDTAGQVIVVFSGKYKGAVSDIIMGRRLASDGTPLGGTCYISEKEPPDLATKSSGGPRISSRNGLVAVAWQSFNDINAPISPTTGENVAVAALRLFITSFESLPILSITQPTPTTVTISWPQSVTGYSLQSNADLTSPNWVTVPGVVNHSVTVNTGSGNQFFRLIK